ncbi:hypothetical protein [Nostoc sp.]
MASTQNQVIALITFNRDRTSYFSSKLTLARIDVIYAKLFS